MKVAVIIPIYNDASFLPTCLDSIISQTERDIEIICIDDCSTDNSLEILNKYSKYDQRIKVEHFTTNKGPGVARNRGIELSNSEYLCFCDADDMYPPYAIKLLYDNIKKFNVSICCGNIRMMNSTLEYFEQNKVLSMIQIDHLQKTNINNPLLWLPYFHQRFIFKKDFIVENKIFYPCQRSYEDPPMLAKALSLAECVLVIPEIIYIYRVSKREKFYFMKNLDNFLIHLQQVVKIYNDSNNFIHAALYINFCMQEILCLKKIYRLNKKQLKKVFSTFDNFFSLILPNKLNPIFDNTGMYSKYKMLKKGRFVLLFYKLYSKLIKSI